MEEQNWKKVSVFEDDEIPYEVRMKHLIEGYRRDLKRLDQLARYAKGLEEENLLLQKKIENTEKWIKSHPDKEELIRKMDTLTKSYPKRVVELKYIKKKVRDIEDYMRYLQSLLDDNDISYEERKPNPSPKVENLNIEDIDILAVRGPNENYEVDEQYCYKFPRPSVTADCIVFTRESTPQVLLIERGDEPFMGCWAFPGGFLNMDETTEQCAIRELKEETGLEVEDPRGRTITVAYLAVVDAPLEVMGQDDAAKAQWFPIDALPELAFDHDEIMKDALVAFQKLQ